MQPQIAIAILTAFGLFLAATVHIVYWFHYATARIFDPSPVSGTEYDYIVVGSGSSGSPLTARLAEAGHSVLLIEAGGPTHFLMVITKWIF